MPSCASWDASTLGWRGRHRRSIRAVRLHSWACPNSTLNWNSQLDQGAFADRAGDLQHAPVRLGYPLDEVQAEPGAARLGREKLLGGAAQLTWIHALPLILHAEYHAIGALGGA